MTSLLRHWWAWRQRYRRAAADLGEAEVSMRRAERKHDMRAVHRAQRDVKDATTELLRLEQSHPIKDWIRGKAWVSKIKA